MNVEATRDLPKFKTFFKQLVIFSSVRFGSARLGILGAVFQPDETKIKNIFGKVKVILSTLANVKFSYPVLKRPVRRKINSCNKLKKIKADKEF